MVTLSRALWFAGIFVLTAPVLLAVFRDGGELTGKVWGLSIATALVLAITVALVFGKGRGH